MSASTQVIQKYRDLNEPMSRRHCPLCGQETWQIPIMTYALPYSEDPSIPTERIQVAWRCDSCLKITDVIKKG